MQRYKEEFIEFLVRSGALKFGDFTLKSGRRCPYFLNIGQFYRGSNMSELSRYYAAALVEEIKDFDIVFGPAYKGIPLSVAITLSLYKDFDKDVAYSYNRKEVKNHGEGGVIVGCPVSAESKIVIVDDVMTAGTAVRETFGILKDSGTPQIKGVIIAVDRMEKGQGEKSAVMEIREEFGFHVYSIVTIKEIVQYLHGREIDGKVVIDDEKKTLIDNYRMQYGV